MSKYCPHCHCSTECVKIGKTGTGKQRYRCKECNHTWTNRSRPMRQAGRIWHDYAIEDLKLSQLCRKYHLGKDKIREILYDYPAPSIISPTSSSHDVVCMDCTYFGHRGKDEWGLLIILDAHTTECLYCEELPGHETWAHYIKALDQLRAFGIKPKACVIDGVVGLADVLASQGIFVQYCQFHQIKTVLGYITRNPVLEPNKELKRIILELKYRSKKEFATIFNTWFYKHQLWLREKTRNPDTHRLEYAHQKTRSAVHSLQRNFKYLYTFEQHPELKIPNTNNLMEGINSAIKNKLNHHRGARKALKIKLVLTLLSRRTGV